MPAPPQIQPSISPELFRQLAGKDGRLSAKEIGTSGLTPPPKGYQYVYNASNPTNPLGLKKDGNAVLGKLGDVAKVVVPIVLAATGVGAPAAAAIMAGTYAADAKADGKSWGDALKQGVIGGATGYVNAGGIQSAGGKVAANAAIGGAQGAQDGGGVKGALVGAAGGAATSALASKAAPTTAGTVNGLPITGYAPTVARNTAMAGSSGWSGVLQELAKNPETYKALAGVAAGAAKGQAGERTAENNFQTNQNQLLNSQYGTQQSALQQLLALQERATLDRAKLGIEAPSSRMKQALLGSMIQNLQSAKITPPAGVNMGKVTGGVDPSAFLNAATRAGGGELNRQALLALLTKSDVPGPTNYGQTGLMPAPTLGGYKGAGGLETTLSTLGLIGSGYDAVDAARRAQQGKG